MKYRNVPQSKKMKSRSVQYIGGDDFTNDRPIASISPIGSSFQTTISNDQCSYMLPKLIFAKAHFCIDLKIRKNPLRW